MKFSKNQTSLFDLSIIIIELNFFFLILIGDGIQSHCQNVIPGLLHFGFNVKSFGFNFKFVVFFQVRILLTWIISR